LVTQQSAFQTNQISVASQTGLFLLSPFLYLYSYLRQDHNIRIDLDSDDEDMDADLEKEDSIVDQPAVELGPNISRVETDNDLTALLEDRPFFVF